MSACGWRSTEIEKKELKVFMARFARFGAIAETSHIEEAHETGAHI
jgi:hypothetical protein